MVSPIELLRVLEQRRLKKNYALHALIDGYSLFRAC